MGEQKLMLIIEHAYLTVNEYIRIEYIINMH